MMRTAILFLLASATLSTPAARAASLEIKKGDHISCAGANCDRIFCQNKAVWILTL